MKIMGCNKHKIYFFKTKKIQLLTWTNAHKESQLLKQIECVTQATAFQNTVVLKIKKLGCLSHLRSAITSRDTE